MTVETGGLPWWLFLYLLVTVAAGAVSWIRWRGRVVKTLDQGVTIGVFRGGLRLAVVYEEGEGRMVALVFPDPRSGPGPLTDRVLTITPTHARQLAGWLRIAAGKGSALARDAEH
jgi:hypothetical protein